MSIDETENHRSLSIFNPTPLLSYPNSFQYLLQMRENIVDYVEFIHLFAPCVVTCAKWKNQQNFECLSSGSAIAMNDLLTPSDEAFIVLVFLNYAERWISEITMMVSACLVRLVRCS